MSGREGFRRPQRLLVVRRRGPSLARCDGRGRSSSSSRGAAVCPPPLPRKSPRRTSDGVKAALGSLAEGTLSQALGVQTTVQSARLDSLQELLCTDTWERMQRVDMGSE